jgi:BirA family biotin operon repressor/biotin-[acetyl-CoA-carboxylase] ligase
MFNLAAAVAASKAIEQTCSLAADIKWPNDILINGKKCCGILTEMSADLDQIKYLVVGIGINVNHPVFPKSLQEHASSLFLEGGRRFSRIEIILALLKDLEDLT